MKKLFLCLMLLTFFSINVFAARPSGWGLGVLGQYNIAWDGFDRDWGVALSLKAPQYPIYWGVILNIDDSIFGLNFTGDRYLLEENFADDVNFGWYMGLGAYAGFNRYNSARINWTSLRAGARVPIGFYIVPVRFFEAFFHLAPSLGIAAFFGDYPERSIMPEGGMGLDIGVRFWF